MWNEITDDVDKNKFMEMVSYFHDSCIKEAKYISGAYVDEKRSMYPINNQRRLKVIIQRQSKDASMIELEFEGLKYLKLSPLDCDFTCEILDSTLILHNDSVLWFDEGGLSEADLSAHNGTVVSATKLRWRIIDNCMGNNEFYVSLK